MSYTVALYDNLLGTSVRICRRDKADLLKAVKAFTEGGVIA